MSQKFSLIFFDMMTEREYSLFLIHQI